MSHRRLCSFAWLWGLVLASACAAPTAPAEHTPASFSATAFTPPTLPPQAEMYIAIPTPGAEWSYVALGDSSAWGFPTYYARALEADLGVTVKVIKWVRGGMTSAEVLSQLRENEEERHDVREAEVVTFYGNPLGIIGLRITSGNPSDTYDCSPQAVATFKSQMSAIGDEIFALRKGQATIIRTYTRFMPFYQIWRESGQFDEFQRCVAALDTAVLELGREHAILVADCGLALNGPNHDQDPNDRNLLYDGIHENSEGAQIVAQVFRELGYEPVVP